MSAAQDKRFRLHVVGGAEQVPRLLTAYGRACEGEVALALRPREGRGLLLLVTGGKAAVWEASSVADSPRRPEGAHPLSRVLAQISVERDESTLTAPGPISLRGEWSGELVCDDGQPVISLHRKLATYGVLSVQSEGARGWRWVFQRNQQWFADMKAMDRGGYPTLSAAVEAGLGVALGLVASACQVRDTSRRAAMDSTYAEKHPLKTKKPGKDPTQRFQPKEPKPAKPAKPAKEPRPAKEPKAEKPKREPRAEDPSPKRGRKAEPGAPAPLHAPVVLPPVPSSADELNRLVGEVKAEADALKEIRSRSWAAENRNIPDKLSAWFKRYKLTGIASELDEMLFELRTGTSRDVAGDIAGFIERVEGSGLPKAVTEEAREKLLAVQRAAESEPMPVERARRLIRYAMRLIDSKLCQGVERDQAVEALQKAVGIYEGAREKLLLEQADEVSVSELRRIAEQVSLTAAKVARSCGRGQQSVLKPHRERAEAPVSAPVADAQKKRERPRKEPTPEAANEAVDPKKDAAIMDALEDRLEQFLARRRKSA